MIGDPADFGRDRRVPVLASTRGYVTGTAIAVDGGADAALL